MPSPINHRIPDLRSLQYIVTHVFLPLRLPDGDDDSNVNDYTLAGAVTSAAHIYSQYLHETEACHWHAMVEMLGNLRDVVQLESLDRLQIISQLSSMNIGDVRAFLIRAQNAAIIFRKQRNATICELFEVSPRAKDVMASQGRLVCSYPGPAIEIPSTVFDDEGFLSELANFLVHMNNDILDAAPTSRKANSTVAETRDTTHPRYISELLTGILRGVGRSADIVRISKRIGDDVLWKSSELPWRRSSIWLVIRVVLQASLERSTYKEFMLFFMCCLANENINICAELSNDSLQAMSAKISRRLRKLEPVASEWLSCMVLETCTSLRSTLDKRWKQVQDAHRVSPLWAPSQLDLAENVQLSLLNGRDYIRNALVNQITNSPTAPFKPEHRQRGTLDDFLSSDGTFFEKVYRAEPLVVLYDVESTVEEGIDAWIGQVIDNHGASVKLEFLANRYSSSALKAYENNPELLSVMLLTMIELWVALDKIAVKETPILADYSPEVPTGLLEDLLVCRKGSLRRLCSAYQYLSHRHLSSKRGWSVFSPEISSNSFSVRFYRSSLKLQTLKYRIENAAQEQVRLKVNELEQANDRHAELQGTAAKTDHDHKNGSVKQCHRCIYDKQLKKMKIAIYEWPLPAQQLHAEAVVFELNCPVSFNMWRTATLHLLVDLCTPSVHSQIPYIQLPKYTPLQPYFIQHPRSRVTLASDSKPFVVTHYKKTSIPSTQERVCVNNGLNFYGFDNCARIAVSGALGHEDVKKNFIYHLPGGPYENLQKYVDATSHTSNEIMANQADCDNNLSIHEFIAFGHVRSGGSLQWLNILRELRARSLSFHRPEVHLLFAQAVSQVGPLAHAERKWHREIEQPSFCYALLDELEKLLRDVEANWLEVVTMDTISLLLRRLLASNHNSTVLQKLLGLLHVVRHKIFCWLQELSDKLMKAPGDEDVRGLLRDAAAVCRGTFDVDISIVLGVLFTAEEIKVLLACAMLIHYHTPTNVSSLSSYSQLLLDRNKRLSLALENVVRDAIQADPDDQGVDLAVGWIWPEYRPGSKWVPLLGPNSRWISCTTAPTASQKSQEVHLNLLDGSLLVGGKSLGRMPSEIQNHPLYFQFFGKKILDVMPADLPGMDYSSRIANHQLYFSLRGKDLVIREVTGSSETVELIPPEKLKGDLPAVLIEGHAHWLNHSTSTMEIRPTDDLWQSCPENQWQIDCAFGYYRMYKGREFLIDIRSKSWGMVSRLLKPLDTAQNLIVTVSDSIDSDQSSSSLHLSVSLPRYGLSFFVNENGDLQSHNLRDMVYDVDQSIGTFFGLVNQLVLRPKLDGLILRCVIIPEGKVSFQRDGCHVRVEIDTQGSTHRRVTYQTYRTDTDVGYLAGNANLTNRLFCAYLHALTSGCGPDPLTGRLGTEEALSLLRSAECWSIMKFSSRDAELLCSIASICPSRTWYPNHLKCMQKVEWVDLPVRSQHHGLYHVCKAIKEHYERVQLFNEGSSSTFFEDFPHRDERLLERSSRRSAYMFPHDVSESVPSGTSEDVRYSARDTFEAGSGERRACVAATVIYHRTASSPVGNIILNLLNSWTKNVVGNTALSFQYDRSWLAPDLPSIWIEAYNLLRRSEEDTWFQLLFSLSAMAYASPELKDLVPVFVAFATDSRLRAENPPKHDSYDLSKGYEPSLTTLHNHVLECAYHFESSPEGKQPRTADMKQKKWRKRQLQLYNDRRKVDATAAAKELSNVWPHATALQCSLNPASYDVVKLTSNVQNLFARCHHNLELKKHLTRVQQILNFQNVRKGATAIPISQYSFDPSPWTHTRFPWSLTVAQLFGRPAPSLRTNDRMPLQFTTKVENTSFSGSTQLQNLITAAEANAENRFQRRYVSALRVSAGRFGGELSLGAQSEMKAPTTETLGAYYAQCTATFAQSLEDVKRWLGPKSKSEQALERSGHWPHIIPQTLFQCLASNSLIVPTRHWRRCLITLAMLALELQRARRLVRLHRDNLREELQKELENEVCDGWDPEAHPDWLLIQLQSNFLVRRVQAEVANEMIAPRSGSNTAMQLNMGEGKSSVIVPIVVTTLADGCQFVRVVVPKALTAQMFHLLVDRLGKLVNRRIYFLPFSRSLQVDHQKVSALYEIMLECMNEQGILVVQPEHVLSLKLISVEKQLPGHNDAKIAETLLKIQRWLYSYSRDILDESDEILHVRYQLVYTVGLQQAMEGFPERWITTEQVLGLVYKHAPSLEKLFPLGVEYDQGPPGVFPHLRILDVNAGGQLITWIVQDIINDSLPTFSFGQLSLRLRNALRTFILREMVPPKEANSVLRYSQGTSLWSGLLLLRGLLAKGILLHAFMERRWRVDYGLAPKRTMLAVPYRAKDVPAQRAEFGHPDVAIILTCLSYYYGGLTEEQLQLSFEILLKQDDPALDYALWVRNCPDVPVDLRTLSGVNMKSPEQWNTFLFPLFARNRETINFYLSSVVFPKEAKEFPSKLSCSGWDLAETKVRLVTGFSGTNDSQYLLPLHIIQRDPDHQRGTNAKVLSYLLQPENNHYMCTTLGNGTTYEFLDTLVMEEPEIRVLLDVGAQMLDLQNQELAEAWLDIHPTASAAIYFNEDDELTVRTRDGNTQLLLSSPFAQQLDQCVVYLDDAHTRGTDVKFPSGFRAAVTLGPKVTKDRLTQGCMRMRKLGHGHSVMFFAPPEVDRRIREVAEKDSADMLSTMDIMHWAIHETCEEIQQRAPHWAQQGMDHISRFSAWTGFCKDQLSPKALSNKWLQPEAKKLENLYGLHTTLTTNLSAVPDIHQRCIELGVLSSRDVSLDEEQEREVIHEAEREWQQVERPPKVIPAGHSVHLDVISFVKTGIVPTHFRTAFSPAFEALDATSAATSEAHMWSCSVLVTRDFQKTVSSGSSSKSDDYLRPVQWILSAKRGSKETLVIMSPYEVDQLIPHIRSSTNVHLHIYTPRVTKLMKSCDDLALYSIPAVPTGWTVSPWLVDQLNVFSGQLYLEDYETYTRLCRLLCVYTKDLQDEQGVEIGVDGFILPSKRPMRSWFMGYTFQSSPMNFIKKLMSLRRKGMRFAPTHIGKLLDGRLLSQSDFDGDDVGNR